MLGLGRVYTWSKQGDIFPEPFHRQEKIMYKNYIQDMAFVRTQDWSFGEISMTPRMLRVLSCIEGVTALADIEKQVAVSFEELCNEIYNLLHLNLIAFNDRGGQRGYTNRVTAAENKYYAPPVSRVIVAEA